MSTDNITTTTTTTTSNIKPGLDPVYVPLHVQANNESFTQTNDQSSPYNRLYRHEFSFTHKMKTKFSHINTTTHSCDPEYQYALANYDKFNQALSRLEARLIKYRESLKGLMLNASSVYSELSQLLRENCLPSDKEVDSHKEVLGKMYPYILEFTSRHSHLNEATAEVIVRDIQVECLDRIDRTLQEYITVNKRIRERDVLHKDVDYYRTKLAKLEASKGEHIATKELDPKAGAKLERNQAKFQEAHHKFSIFEQILIEDLTKIWHEKDLILAPIVEAFAQIEHKLFEVYTTNDLAKFQPNAQVENDTNTLDGVKDMQLQPTNEDIAFVKEKLELTSEIPLNNRLEDVETNKEKLPPPPENVETVISIT